MQDVKVHEDMSYLSTNAKWLDAFPGSTDSVVLKARQHESS